MRKKAKAATTRLSALALASAATLALPPVAGAAAPAMAQAQNPCAPAGARQDNGQNKPKKKSDDSGKSSKPSANPCAPA